MWTIAETVVTTRIITPDSVSSRSDQSTSTPPAVIQLAIGTTWGPLWARIPRNTRMPSAIAASSAPQVTTCEKRSPIVRPKNPAIAAASSGRKTTSAAAIAIGSAPHHVDVLDLDRAAIAEVDDQDGEADRRFRRRHRQDEHRKDLPRQIVQHDREGDEIDVDREQHQFDRHHDDDDVLAVEKNAEHAGREQDRRNRQVMREANRHSSVSRRISRAGAQRDLDDGDRLAAAARELRRDRLPPHPDPLAQRQHDRADHRDEED